MHEGGSGLARCLEGEGERRCSPAATAAAMSATSCGARRRARGLLLLGGGGGARCSCSRYGENWAWLEHEEGDDVEETSEVLPSLEPSRKWPPARSRTQRHTPGAVASSEEQELRAEIPRAVTGKRTHAKVRGSTNAPTRPSSPLSNASRVHPSLIPIIVRQQIVHLCTVPPPASLTAPRPPPPPIPPAGPWPT